MFLFKTYKHEIFLNLKKLHTTLYLCETLLDNNSYSHNKEQVFSEHWMHSMADTEEIQEAYSTYLKDKNS